MCEHYHAIDHYDVYFHLINPNIPCRVTFSFGFYCRNNQNGPNPYGLLPIPSQNSYMGPFNTWMFSANLRIKCNQHGIDCPQNINLAQQFHTYWIDSMVWQTHPNYFNNHNDQGVDFIADPNIDELYMLRIHPDPRYREIGDWLIRGIEEYDIGIEVIEVDQLPDDCFDFVTWILARIADINNFEPFEEYLEDNNLQPIPVIAF